MVAEQILTTLASKVSEPVIGRISGWWERRVLAKQLHTALYEMIHDRPDAHDHPPTFYRDLAEYLDRAVELGLFSDHELEYLAEKLAEYCRAKEQGGTTKAVQIDKTYLDWTNVMETEEMHPFDVSEIEKRLRHDLETTYGQDRFDHPVGEEIERLS